MWQLHMKIGTRHRSFEKSTKECLRQGGMSDKLLRMHLAPNQNSGMKWSIARCYPKVCASRACTKKDAPAKQHGIWRKTFTSSRIRTTLRVMFLVKSNVSRHLSLQRDQERKFVVDSGASRHTMSKRDCERRSANPRGGTGVRL